MVAARRSFFFRRIFMQNAGPMTLLLYGRRAPHRQWLPAARARRGRVPVLDAVSFGRSTTKPSRWAFLRRAFDDLRDNLDTISAWPPHHRLYAQRRASMRTVVTHMENLHRQFRPLERWAARELRRRRDRMRTAPTAYHEFRDWWEDNVQPHRLGRETVLNHLVRLHYLRPEPLATRARRTVLRGAHRRRRQRRAPDDDA